MSNNPHQLAINKLEAELRNILHNRSTEQEHWEREQKKQDQRAANIARYDKAALSIRKAIRALS